MLPPSCMQHGQRLVMKNFLSQNLGSCGHLALIWKATPPLWVTCLVLLMLCGQIACERQTFLLSHHSWETFREEESLRLSDRNSILMTQNLSGIRSEALIIGWRSSFIVLAIVCDDRQKTKGRKGQMETRWTSNKTVNICGIMEGHYENYWVTVIKVFTLVK